MDVKKAPGENVLPRTIGGRIRFLLEARGMKQIEIAEAIGVTQAAISNIVTDDTRRPSADTLLKLAAALQANPHWIMTSEGKPFEVNVVGRNSEKQLLAAFREMDATAQAALMGVADSMRRKN